MLRSTRRHLLRCGLLALALSFLAAAAHAQGFERWRSTRGADFLPAQLRKSELHRVDDEVLVEG